MKNTVHLLTAPLIMFLAIALFFCGPVRGESPVQGALTPAAPKPDGNPLLLPHSGSIGEAGPTRADAVSIPYHSTIEAYIDKNDRDTYRFDFPGGRMRIASRGGLDIVADLLDLNGGSIARGGQDLEKNVDIEKELPAGTYYVEIMYRHHAGEGAYMLILGDGNAARLKEASSRV